MAIIGYIYTLKYAISEYIETSYLNIYVSKYTNLDIYKSVYQYSMYHTLYGNTLMR